MLKKRIIEEFIANDKIDELINYMLDTLKDVPESENFKHTIFIANAYKKLEKDQITGVETPEKLLKRKNEIIDNIWKVYKQGDIKIPPLTKPKEEHNVLILKVKIITITCIIALISYAGYINRSGKAHDTPDAERIIFKDSLGTIDSIDVLERKSKPESPKELSPTEYLSIGGMVKNIDGAAIADIIVSSSVATKADTTDIHGRYQLLIPANMVESGENVTCHFESHLHMPKNVLFSCPKNNADVILKEKNEL